MSKFHKVGDGVVEIGDNGYPVDDLVELPIKQVSVHLSDPGWEVVCSFGTDENFTLYEDGDNSLFFDDKNEAISEARYLFRLHTTAAILEVASARDFGREMKVIRSRVAEK